MLNEKEVKKILHSHRVELKAINKRILELYHSSSDTEGLIESIQLRSASNDGMPSSSGGFKPDLSNVMISHMNIMRSWRSELFASIQKLIEREECINRVLVCYRSLPQTPYEILTRLYVDNELYKTVETDLGKSHRSFERCRKDAIELIVKLYNSNLTNADIITYEDREKVKKRARGKKKPSNYEQLTFIDDLEES